MYILSLWVRMAGVSSPPRRRGRAAKERETELLYLSLLWFFFLRTSSGVLAGIIIISVKHQ
jgi:hypothetical protein